MILIDSSFIIAALVATDVNHPSASLAIGQLGPVQMVAAPVLHEVVFHIAKRVDYLSAADALEQILRLPFKIVDLTTDDQQRIIRIMRRYQSAKFDYVDCAIMALSERLNITRVATFDRRDFSIYKRDDGQFLMLIPV